MARKAKTVIGERDLAQSQTMMKAAESGQASRQRASEQLSAESGKFAQTMLTGGQAVGRGLESYEARKSQEKMEGERLKQQQKEFKQVQEAKEKELQGLTEAEAARLAQERDIAIGKEIQEEKRRTSEMGMKGFQEEPGGPTTPLQAGQQQQPQAQQPAPGGAPAPAAQPQGVQAPGPYAPGQAPGAGAVPGAQAPGQPPPLLQRPDVLQAESQRPGEMTRPGRVSMTPEAQEAQLYAREQGAREFELKQSAEKARILNAQAEFRKGEAAYMDAETKAGAAKVEQQARAEEEMSNAMASIRELRKRMSEGADPSQVAYAFADNSDVLEALQSNDQARIASTTMRVLNEQLANLNLRMTAMNGNPMTDASSNNEVYRRFSQREFEMTAAFEGLSDVLDPFAAMEQPSGMQPPPMIARPEPAGAGGLLQTMPGADPSQMPPFQAAVAQRQRQLVRSWQGITDPTEQIKFIRKATARSMMRADELRKIGAELQARGQTEQVADLTQQVAEQAMVIAAYQQADRFGGGATLPFGRTGEPEDPALAARHPQGVPADVYEETAGRVRDPEAYDRPIEHEQEARTRKMEEARKRRGPLIPRGTWLMK